MTPQRLTSLQWSTDPIARHTTHNSQIMPSFHHSIPGQFHTTNMQPLLQRSKKQHDISFTEAARYSSLHLHLHLHDVLLCPPSSFSVSRFPCANGLVSHIRRTPFNSTILFSGRASGGLRNLLLTKQRLSLEVN